jgi:hypothetical protein
MLGHPSMHISHNKYSKTLKGDLIETRCAQPARACGRNNSETRNHLHYIHEREAKKGRFNRGSKEMVDAPCKVYDGVSGKLEHD